MAPAWQARPHLPAQHRHAVRMSGAHAHGSMSLRGWQAGAGSMEWAMGGQARLTIRCTLELDFLFWTHHSKGKEKGKEEVRRKAQRRCRLAHQQGPGLKSQEQRKQTRSPALEGFKQLLVPVQASWQAASQAPTKWILSQCSEIKGQVHVRKHHWVAIVWGGCTEPAHPCGHSLSLVPRSEIWGAVTREMTKLPQTALSFLKETSEFRPSRDAAAFETKMSSLDITWQLDAASLLLLDGHVHF